MRKLFTAPLQLTSLAIAIYIGLALNATTLWKNLGDTLNSQLITLMSAIGVTAFVFLLLTLASTGGQRFYKTMTSLLVAFSSIASYYMIFFNTVIGYGIIVSVLTTDTDLSVESVGYKLVLWFTFTGVAPAALLWLTDIREKAPSRLQIRFWASRLLAGVASIAVAGACFDNIDKISKADAANQNVYVGSPSGMIAHTYLPANWIAALALYGWEKGYGEKGMDELFDPAKHFTYKETTPLDDTYVVVIIGETTRSDHMGILGYERDTTPKMAQEKNLVALRGVSCDTATKLSLKCMFVRKGGTEENEQRTLREFNIFAVLSDLGFSSELFAMQSEMWFYNSLRTDSYKFREILAAENTSTGKRLDDMLLADELGRSVAAHPQGKHLVVLHMKGSHYLYSQRYPQEFARFTPECTSIDASCSAETMINAFDNSVLYIDTIMANIFDHLRDKKAIVVFTTDHGESINDDEHFHATPRKVAPPEQFRVPMVVWASDAFLQASPQNAEAFANLRNLQQNNAIVAHTVLFDSILGCLGYESPDGGIDHHNNICSRSYTETPIQYPLGGAYTDQGAARLAQN